MVRSLGSAIVQVLGLIVGVDGNSGFDLFGFDIEDLTGLLVRELGNGWFDLFFSFNVQALTRYEGLKLSIP